MSNIPDLYVNTIIESRNASFFEEIFLYKSTQESSSFQRNFESTSSTSHDQELMEERNKVEPRSSKRTKTSKSFGSNFLTCMLEDESQSFKEAISTPKAPFGKKLSIVRLNPSYKIIHGNQWIFHQVVNLQDINRYSRGN